MMKADAGRNVAACDGRVRRSNMLSGMMACLLMCLGVHTAWAGWDGNTPVAETGSMGTLSPIVLDLQSEESQRLLQNVEIRREPAAQATVEEMDSPRESGFFKPVITTDFRSRYTQDAIWLRFTLKNPSNRAISRFLEVGAPRLQNVRLYQKASNGEWRIQQNGSLQASWDRPVNSRLLAFPLEFQPGETVSFYLRIQSANAIVMSLRLWEPQEFHAAEKKVDIVNSLQFGALLLFVIYGLLFFASTRDTGFLYFSMIVASCLLNDIALLQYGSVYLWADLPDWNLRSPGILGSPILIGGTLLFIRLLALDVRHPRLTLFLKMSLVAVGGGMLAMFWLDYAFWVMVQQLIGLGLLLFLAAHTFYNVWKGEPGAALVLASFFVTWFISLMRLAQILGWLPPDFAMDYSQNWAMLLSGLLIVGLLRNNFKKLEERRQQLETEAKLAQVRSLLMSEKEIFLRTQDLRIAKESAEQASRSKSDFIAQLSHELRTPLHSILGYTKLILADKPADVLQYRAGVIQRSGQHLLDMINELLDYARGEAGRLQLNNQAVLLRALLQSLCDEQRLIAQTQSINLHLSSNVPADLMVLVDAMRLRQVLINLMSNACRHSQGTQIILRAHATLQANRLNVEFGVKDDGIGISEEQRERLFNPFEQGREKTALYHRFSLGLGLAIAKQLVKLMGGELCYSTPKNGGAAFTFHLSLPLTNEKGTDEKVGKHVETGEAESSLWYPPARESVADVLPRPSADALSRLQKVVREGAITDIEEWVEEVMIREPEAAAFALAVQRHLQGMDMEGILKMCS